MATLGRDALKQLVKYKSVPAPELGGDIRLRSLSAATMLDLVERFDPEKNRSTKAMLELGATMLALCWVDDAGELVLGPDESNQLLELPMDILERLCDAVYELNGLNKGAAAEAKKNLATTTATDPGSS